VREPPRQLEQFSMEIDKESSRSGPEVDEEFNQDLRVGFEPL